MFTFIHLSFFHSYFYIYALRISLVIKWINFQISREVLDAAARVIRPGITTDEIDRVVHEATIAAGIRNNRHVCSAIIIIKYFH